MLPALRVPRLNSRNAGVPQENGPVGRGGGQLPAARREGHAGDALRVAFQGRELASIGRVPQFDGAVEAAAGQKLAARREGQREDHVLVALERPQLLAGGGVPELDRAILTAACQNLALGREDKRPNLAAMSPQFGALFRFG